METKPIKPIDLLIADDNSFNLKIAEKILDQSFSTISARSGQAVLELLQEYAPKVILLDMQMPQMDGRETMARLQADEQWKKIPVIFMIESGNPDMMKECLALGGVDFIVKPFVPSVLLGRVNRTLELFGLRRDMDSRLQEKTRLVERISLNAIMVIANTIDAKDPYTSGHSARVARCSGEIARKLGWSESEVRNIQYVALLHDIGKIGIPDAILNKPSRLSDEEFAIIKTHPVIGGKILKDIHMLQHVEEGALYHHERYDGKGYPFGLKGEDIPLCARIIGIADAYDAMSSNRIYRYKLSNEQVISEFERCTGTQFDPELGKLFIQLLQEGFHIPTEADSSDVVSWDRPAVGEGDGAFLNKALVDYESGMQSRGATDLLTDLLNRNNGESTIGTLLNSGHKGTFLLIDLDNFKGINETFGHLAGDRMLKVLADAIKDSAGEKDVMCRMGGDEFVVFLTDQRRRDEILTKMENIIHTFSDSLEKMHSQNLTTVSIGAAICPDDGRSFETLYNSADKALYYVKMTGKNSYAFYSSGQQRQAGKGPDMDLDHIRTIIEGGMDKSSGAFKVQYGEFKKLYNYISRCVKRKGQMVQTLLFTIGSASGEDIDNTIFEEAMAALEVAAAYSLRMVDVGSRYSSVQYIVILVDATLENGKMVAERVIKQFYKIFSSTSIALSYDIQTMVTGDLEVGNLGT